MNKKLIDISKTVSYALRHKPEEFNIKLDKEGWVDFNADKLRADVAGRIVVKLL